MRGLSTHKSLQPEVSQTRSLQMVTLQSEARVITHDNITTGRPQIKSLQRETSQTEIPNLGHGDIPTRNPPKLGHYTR